MLRITLRIKIHARTYFLNYRYLYLFLDKSGMGQKAKNDEETSLALLQSWKPSSNKHERTQLEQKWTIGVRAQ